MDDGIPSARAAIARERASRQRRIVLPKCPSHGASAGCRISPAREWCDERLVEAGIDLRAAADMDGETWAGAKVFQTTASPRRVTT